MEAELSTLSLKKLKGRARELGASAEAIEDLDDAAEPKAAAIDLIVDLTPSAPAAAAASSEPGSGEEDLTALSVKELKKRARRLGATDEAIEDLDDADDVKVATIALIDALGKGNSPPKSDPNLRTKLQSLSVKELKKRARASGATEQAIEDLDDAVNVKAAAIELVVLAHASSDASVVEEGATPPSAPLLVAGIPQDIDVVTPEASDEEDSDEGNPLENLAGQACTASGFELISQLAEGGKHTIFQAKKPATGTIVAVKVHTDRAVFREELDNLRTCAGGSEFVVQLEDANEQVMCLFMQLAENGSLDQFRDFEAEGGMDETEVKMWIKKTLMIVQYLHFNKLGHNDLKVQNMLVFKKNIMKACDMDLMGKFGSPRKREVTPYICSPEVALHILQDSGLKINGHADIWCVGVMTFYMFFGTKPFDEFLDPSANILEDKVARIAKLTEVDIDAVLTKAGATGQLRSFLKRCWAIDPKQRADVGTLLKSGFVDGSTATQFRRDTGGKVDQLLDGQTSLRGGQVALLEGQATLIDGQMKMRHDLRQIRGQLGKVLVNLEAVRNTIVNLNSADVPLIFIIEPQAMITEKTMKSADFKMGQGVRGRKDTFSKFKAIFSTEGSIEKAKKAVDIFSGGTTVTLRLVDQYSGEPVGEGYKIDTPGDVLPQMLPLMEVGLKVMKGVNGMGSLGRMFGLPGPKMPQSWIDASSAVIDGLSSGDQEYACVTEAAGLAVAGKEGEDRKTALSQFQVRQFKAFLDKHDPKEQWRDSLSRIALKTGEVLWVSESSMDNLDAQGQLGHEICEMEHISIAEPTLSSIEEIIGVMHAQQSNSEVVSACMAKLVSEPVPSTLQLAFSDCVEHVMAAMHAHGENQSIQRDGIKVLAILCAGGDTASTDHLQSLITAAVEQLQSVADRDLLQAGCELIASLAKNSSENIVSAGGSELLISALCGAQKSDDTPLMASSILALGTITTYTLACSPMITATPIRKEVSGALHHVLAKLEPFYGDLPASWGVDAYHRPCADGISTELKVCCLRLARMLVEAVVAEHALETAAAAIPAVQQLTICKTATGFGLVIDDDGVILQVTDDTTASAGFQAGLCIVSVNSVDVARKQDIIVVLSGVEVEQSVTFGLVEDAMASGDHAAGLPEASAVTPTETPSTKPCSDPQDQQLLRDWTDRAIALSILPLHAAHTDIQKQCQAVLALAAGIAMGLPRPVDVDNLLNSYAAGLSLDWGTQLGTYTVLQYATAEIRGISAKEIGTYTYEKTVHVVDLTYKLLPGQTVEVLQTKWEDGSLLAKLHVRQKARMPIGKIDRAISVSPIFAIAKVPKFWHTLLPTHFAVGHKDAEFFAPQNRLLSEGGLGLHKAVVKCVPCITEDCKSSSCKCDRTNPAIQPGQLVNVVAVSRQYADLKQWAASKKEPAKGANLYFKGVRAQVEQGGWIWITKGESVLFARQRDPKYPDGWGRCGAYKTLSDCLLRQEAGKESGKAKKTMSNFDKIHEGSTVHVLEIVLLQGTLCARVDQKSRPKLKPHLGEKNVRGWFTLSTKKAKRAKPESAIMPQEERMPKEEALCEMVPSHQAGHHTTIQPKQQTKVGAATSKTTSPVVPTAGGGGGASRQILTLAAVLAEARVDEHAGSLQEMGCVDPRDLLDVLEEDAKKIGMTKVEFKRLRRILSERML